MRLSGMWMVLLSYRERRPMPWRSSVSNAFRRKRSRGHAFVPASSDWTSTDGASVWPTLGYVTWTSKRRRSDTHGTRLSALVRCQRRDSAWRRTVGRASCDWREIRQREAVDAARSHHIRRLGKPARPRVHQRCRRWWPGDQLGDRARESRRLATPGLDAEYRQPRRRRDRGGDCGSRRQPTGMVVVDGAGANGTTSVFRSARCAAAADEQVNAPLARWSTASGQPAG